MFVEFTASFLFIRLIMLLSFIHRVRTVTSRYFLFTIYSNDRKRRQIVSRLECELRDLGAVLELETNEK